MAETFGWTQGLDQKARRAKRFYAVIVLCTVAGAALNFVGVNPIKALFWAAVLNGFVAPPMLLLIMFVANNPKVMGKDVNGTSANVLGWATTVAMFAAAIGLVVTGQ